MPDAVMMDSAPRSVSVPTENLGMIIGRAGGTIKRLIQATGCQIEVPRAPKKDAQDGEGITEVQLSGSDQSCLRAAEAIKDILKGGDFEDHAARAEGAMVIPHELNNFDREAWVAWRLVATEKEHGVRVDTGRRALRIWAAGGKGLRGPAAEKVRAAVEAALAAAQELIEITVDAAIEHEPDNASYDTAVAPLVDQYGVKLWVPRPEGGVVPIKIVGPDEPARDAAALFEARYVKGKATASVLQVPGQVQSMAGQMSNDYASDIRALETELKVKVTQSKTMLWVAGANAEAVANARQTIRDMLTFYFPDIFYLRKELHPSVIEWIRADEDMRLIRASTDCVLVLDEKEGSAWICGKKRHIVQERIEKILERFAKEHWEQDLEDYGVAMYLLGPKGSGDYVGRMQWESGAKIKVCPNALKVIIEGKPDQVEHAKKLVLEGLEKLAEKKRLNPTPPSELAAQQAQSVDGARAALEKFHAMLRGRGNTPSPTRKGKGGGKGKGKASASSAAPEAMPASRSTILRASDIFGSAAPAAAAVAAQRAAAAAPPEDVGQPGAGGRWRSSGAGGNIRERSRSRDRPAAGAAAAAAAATAAAAAPPAAQAAAAEEDDEDAPAG